MSAYHARRLRGFKNRQHERKRTVSGRLRWIKMAMTQIRRELSDLVAKLQPPERLLPITADGRIIFATAADYTPQTFRWSEPQNPWTWTPS